MSEPASETPTGPDPVSDPALRTEALEQLLTERGLVVPAVVDGFVARYEREVGPMIGARVVARAWTDPAYRARLLADAVPAIQEVAWGGGANGEHIVVVENSAAVHHVVVCTLCSCYPWPVLGLPPSWYKDPAYRSRVVREPRAVLAEMGLTLPADVRIEVHDSSAEVRWLVLPERPAGTEGLDEEQLATLVTRDTMVGVAKVAVTADLAVDGPAAPPRSNGELLFTAPWESRAFGMAVALHEADVFAWETFQHALVARIAAPGERPYYADWLGALEDVLALTPEIDTRAAALAPRPVGHDHPHRPRVRHHDP